MTDFLTHLFLPLTVAYVLRRDLFPSPAYLLVGAFGLFSDFDKFLGMPGLLHSLVTLVPITIAILTLERWWRGELQLSPLIVALIFSHLVLDFVGGGPVPLLYPVIREGIGLYYPAQTVFGEGPFGLWIKGPLVTLRTAAPRPGYNTYGFIRGYGVASLLVFSSVFWGLRQNAS